MMPSRSFLPPAAGLALAVVLAALLPAPPAAAAPDAKAALEAAAEQDWPTAGELWAQVVRANPTDRIAVLGLAEAVSEGNLFALLGEADSAVRALNVKDPEDGAAWAARGALALTSTGAPSAGSTVKMVYGDAEEHFKKALEASPDLEAGAVGLARVHFAMGRTDEALAALTAYLARGTKTQGGALFWQGEIRYRQALAAHRDAGGTYPVAGEARALFEQARGSFMASTKADPARIVAWVELGYTCQYLQDVDGAAEAYEAAVARAPQQEAAIKGLSAVLTYDRPRYIATLERIAKAKPKHAMVHYFLGHERLQAGDMAGATKALTIAAENLRRPAAAWYALGQVEDKAGRAEAAAKAYRKALEADPAHELAAWQLETPLREGGLAKAKSSLKGAKEVVEAYDDLLKLAPRNALLLNNMAFLLRDAYDAHKGDRTWQPILEASTNAYVRASEVIGEWGPQYEAMPIAERMSNAQVISDTGLMFQFYPATANLEKAERYYLSALDWSDNGYFDAFNNLSQIYAQAQRWNDLYDLADVCAESLKNPDGSAHPGRAAARQLARKIESEGKLDR